MVLINGGRGSDGHSLNDLWGLRLHKNGDWDWTKANSESQVEPISRYQHSISCYENILILVGGRSNNNLSENPVIELYNLDTSKWFKLGSFGRFRHTSWIYKSMLFIYGGFENTQPPKATGKMEKISLIASFNSIPSLKFRQGGNNPMKYSNTQGNNREPLSRDKRGYFLAETAVIATMDHDENVVETFPIEQLLDEGKKLENNTINERREHEQKLYRENLADQVTSMLIKPSPWIPKNDYSAPLQKQLFLGLCNQMIQILQEERTVLYLRPPTKVFGNIYGQYNDLMRIFDQYGGPLETKELSSDLESLDYLFLGNYVDRGKYSLEVISVLFALKIKFPEQIHLLRGSHEDSKINKVYGFGLECKLRFKENIDSENSVFQAVNKVFEYLPLAAVIADKILCVHSGIGETIVSIKEVEMIKRPFKINYNENSREQKLHLDLLWSDPVLSENTKDTRLNEERKLISSQRVVRYGIERIRSFMRNNYISVIIRSHECVMDGVEKFANTNLYTVFSCTDYGGKYKNKAAILLVKKNWRNIDAKILDYIPGASKWSTFPRENSLNNGKKVLMKDSLKYSVKYRPVTPPRQYLLGKRGKE